MKNTLALLAIFAIILLFPQKRNVPDLSTVKNINAGGCGYFAKYYHLRYPKSQIVHFYTKRYSKLHYMVFFPVTGEYVDCEGFTKYPRWLVFNHRVVSLKFLDSALNTQGWKANFNKADTTIIKQSIFAQ